MTIEEQILKRLSFRTPPFAPRINRDGLEVSPDVLMRTLDPTKDERLLQYYFDVYDWEQGKLLGGLSATGALKNLPVDQAVLILVSGTDLTGRASLINAILYKIERTTSQKPLVTDVTFSGRDKVKNILALAEVFMTTCAVHAPEIDSNLLNKIWERDSNKTGTGSDAPHASLFSSFRVVVRKSSTRPIVFLMKGGDHYDLWDCVYKSTSQLADYLIVGTSKHADAKTCIDRMKTNVAHIKARKLGPTTALRYVQRRLSSERTVDWPSDKSDDIHPFTENSMKILYEPGDGVEPGSQVHAIGWLNSTLAKIFERHVAALSKASRSINNLTSDDLLIKDETVWETTQARNRGE